MNENFNRRDFLRTVGLGAAAFAFPGCTGFSGRATSRSKLPNIIYILADDMGYGDLTCLNKASKIPTANMDRIAAEGIYFADAHSPSAVCTPTRYGILTGRYCWRTHLKNGVLWGYSPALIEPQRLTVASLLKKHGYRTACVGKWHLGLDLATTDGKKPSSRKEQADPVRSKSPSVVTVPSVQTSNGAEAQNIDFAKPFKGGPNELGFDYFFGIPASLDMIPHLYIENDRAVEIPTLEIEKSSWPVFYRPGPIAPGFKHIEVLPTITKKAVQFIEEHTKQSPENPFFLYFPLTAPHQPWVPVDFVKGRSRAGVYGDFVFQVDWTIGQVLDTLDRLKLTDNTLIIVTSDNGSHWKKDFIKEYSHLANYHFRGMKADIWDGGHRIPFIARWPGKIKPGTSSDETICLSDLMATCAAIVGQELSDNEGEDSYNILPVLLGKKLDKPIREATVHHSSRGMFSVRQGKWKLILGRGSGGFSKPRHIEPKPGEPKGQLYNLQEDIAEEHNLWIGRPDVVRRLTELLEKYKKRGHSREPKKK